MTQPLKLPLLVDANYRKLLLAGDLTEKDKGFFTDPRLRKFWGKVDIYLQRLEQPELLGSAAESIPGAFLAPLPFYGQSGTADRQSPKVRARENQKKTDSIIYQASKLAGELAELLETLEKITHIRPCEMQLMTIVRRLVHDENINRIASYYDGVSTSEALRELQEAMLNFPKSNSIFDGVPGMASQKSSWRDWLREAASNHKTLLQMHPGEFELTESDWLSLARVLIGNQITREAVQDTLRNLSD